MNPQSKYRIACCIGLCCAIAATKVTATTIEDVQKELLEVDRKFSASAEAHGMRAAFTAFAAEDAFRFEPDVGVVRGRMAIDDHNKNVPADLVLTWNPLSADVAASGDMGYTFGTYVSRRPQADGTERVRTGHYMTLWKRQKDGTWKWIFDTGVPDPPPPESEEVRPEEKPTG